MTTLAIALNIPQLIKVLPENVRVPQGDLGLLSLIQEDGSLTHLILQTEASFESPYSFSIFAAHQEEMSQKQDEFSSRSRDSHMRGCTRRSTG